MLLPLTLAILLPAVAKGAEVLCYDCWGNSTKLGQYCSVDRICTGASCYFHHAPSGEWSSGCSSGLADPGLVCQLDGLKSHCHCSSDLCNQLNAVNRTLHDFWPNESPFNKFTFFLPPQLSIYCMECGNLSIAGIQRYVPCDEKHLCLGNYCVTKRGQSPHSYCGTTWEGTSTPRCFKNPGEEEQCVCPQQMCNAVLPPEAMRTTTTVQPLTTTKKGAGSIKCKNGMKFSPNAQAVMMGEKLKEVISGGFGTSGQALEEFQSGINTHICNYSEG